MGLIDRAGKVALLAPMALLAGCVSFGAEPPESLLTLTPTTPAAETAVTGDASTALAVKEFEASARLAVTRVPVQIDDSRVAYLKDATWVDRPARLFRRLVAETIRARSGRVVIDGDDPGVGPQERLSGSLREFGYDARSSEVVIVVDMVSAGSGSGVAARRFRATVPGIPADGDAVGYALNQAANTVAGEIADWIVGEQAEAAEETTES